MKLSLTYSPWHFVAYCISTLTMASSLVGCVSLDAWYYDNVLLNQENKYSIGFGIMSMFGAIIAFWSIVSLVEYIAKKTAQRRSLKIYIVGTVIGQTAIIVIAIVMLILLGAMAYYIFVIVWLFANIIIGLLSLRSPKRESLRPGPIPSQQMEFQFNDNIKDSQPDNFN